MRPSVATSKSTTLLKLDFYYLASLIGLSGLLYGFLIFLFLLPEMKPVML